MPKKRQDETTSATRQGQGKGGRNPSVDHSRRVKDARASGAKGQKSARGLGPPCEKCGQIHKRCSAHNNRGGPCGQQPLRFQQVCRSHGGATKLSKRAAQERMMELVWPALARLDQLVNDPHTDPAIVVKVVSQILDRAHSVGLTRHHQVGVSLEPTAFENLQTSAFVTIVRGKENIIDADNDPEALPSGGVGDEDAALDDLLDQRERTRARDASTRVSNEGHDVVPGRVIDDHLTPDSDLFGYPKSRERRYREAGHTEFDREGTQPEGDPWGAYERRVREGLD